MEEAPMVRWDPRVARLVRPDGGDLGGDSQRDKVRRYLEQGLVRLARRHIHDVPWGTPGKTVETYEVLPFGGASSKRTNIVDVTIWDDGAAPVPGIRCIDYRCRCQWARGTQKIAPGTCSHTLAVHQYRRDATVLA